MNAPLSFVRRALLQYRDKYFETKPFRPVVHVMWSIGISMAWYEGYHHRHLEKLHTEAAEVKRTELKEKHGAGESLARGKSIRKARSFLFLFVRPTRSTDKTRTHTSLPAHSQPSERWRTTTARSPRRRTSSRSPSRRLRARGTTSRTWLRGRRSWRRQRRRPRWLTRPTFRQSSGTNPFRFFSIKPIIFPP